MTPLMYTTYFLEVTTWGFRCMPLLSSPERNKIPTSLNYPISLDIYKMHVFH